MKKTMIIGLLIAVVAMLTIITGVLMRAADNYGMTNESQHVVTQSVIVGSDMREEVECEFDPPLKYINLIMHWYDTNEEMYADYILMADDPKHEDIWGWSSCIWQPDDSWAACDIFVVTPDFVHADMNVDTLGHEVLHGACGGYHD